MRPLHNRGFATIVVLLVLSILAVVALAITSLGSDGLVRLRLEQKGLLAQNAAEAGMWRGILHVADGGAPGTPWTDEPMDNVDAAYTVTVTQGGPTTVNGIDVPSGEYFYVDSVGTTTKDYNPTTRRVGALIRTAPAGGLDVAIFANSELKMQEASYTDTWDSRVAGGYAVSKDDGLGNAHVGVNSGAADSVTGDSDISIDSAQANIYVAAGASPGVVNSSLAGTYQNVVPMSGTKTLEPVVFTPGTAQVKALPGGVVTVDGTPLVGSLPPGKYGQLQVEQGGHLMLSAGVYEFGQVELKEQGTISLDPSTILGPDDRVEMYCTEFKMQSGPLGGAIVNPLGIPEKLRFYSSGQVQMQKVGSEGYFVVYAPGHQIQIQDGGEIYGAIVGDKIELQGGSAVHFDMALKGLDLFGLGGGGGGASGIDVVLIQRF